HVGPVSLCNADDRAVRGKEATIGREPNTVVYVSFGSIVKFSAEQMREIAIGIEASECQFIWVVRECHQEDDGNNWLPEGFEDRTSGRGMIIRGWAPQVLILDHAAIGALALGEMARKAVEEGGSSYFDLSALIEELRSQT
ncbi:unnamed protein product, partial [Linum tenue]